MKPKQRRRWLVTLAICLLGGAFVGVAPFSSQGAAPGSRNRNNHRATPNFDINLLATGLRAPSANQAAALAQLKATYGEQVTTRWNYFAGSPDVIMGLSTAPSADSPETVARAFIITNKLLFGIDESSLVLDDQKQALGGHLLRFQQRVSGIDVSGGGLGLVMTANKEIRMVMGSTFRDATLSTSPALGSSASASIARASLSQYAVSRPAGVEQHLTSALYEIETLLAPALREPRLNVFPTAGGYKLAWNVLTFSRNPFGVFITQVDAANGQVLAREDLVRYFQNPLPYTADVYPTHPVLANPDTGDLANDPATGEPRGLLRAQLRSLNPNNNVTGIDGTLSGSRVIVRNLLPIKQPFAQAASGTWHFTHNNPPLEGQPNEADDLAEPAEHIDEVNVYFFINHLLEYIEDLHRRGDSVHNGAGQGDFPDTYPTSDHPHAAFVHFPNEQGVLSDLSDIPRSVDASSPDAILRSTLGLDDATSFPLIQTVNGPGGPQRVVVTATAYGHGYRLNDPAKEGAVAYHETMHSVSTPIAGFEGSPEGGALSEAQSDLWAYTVGNQDSAGAYVIAGAGIRKLFRDSGLDPNTLAQIRTARSTLKYSQLGTLGTNSFQMHRDGEIFAAAMFDLRELMIASEPQLQFSRPSFADGTLSHAITAGQESWERLFLSSIYILGVSSSDTFVKTRDAMIQSDRLLYSSNPRDASAPGQHEALIWQVFAAHEIGLNAAAPNGGRQTISTQVPQFAAEQEKPAPPTDVSVAIQSRASASISWQPVAGAFAYEILSRQIGKENRRQNPPVAGREYIDGDQATDGYLHVAYVTAPATSYRDRGAIEGQFAPRGLANPIGLEYSVRALSLNANGQVGASDNSAPATVPSATHNVTSRVQAVITNVRFNNGKTELDLAITNNDSTGSLYMPIEFRVVSITDPTVTVRNADNCGSGRGNNPASFFYRPALSGGQTSETRHLVFNNPNARLFVFHIAVNARVLVNPGAATPYEPEPAASSTCLSLFTETFTGLVPASDGGLQLAEGVTYVDVPFTSQAETFAVSAAMTSSLSVDLDLQLLDSAGRVLTRSEGTLTSDEALSSTISPNTRYVYRVVGFAGANQDFRIVSRQSLRAAESSTQTDAATPPLVLTGLLSVTVSPAPGSLNVR